MPESSRKPITRVRGLGLAASVSIVVGSVIGTGIFLKTRVMMCNVETPWLVIIAWIAAGFLSLAGALTYAELAAMMPRAGGEYVFIREGYGRPLAFLYGWTQFAVAYTGSQAAKGVSFAIFLNILAGDALNRTYFTLHLGGYDFPFGHLQVVALSIIIIATLVNCLAVSVSGKVSVFLTGLKILIVLAIGVCAFLLAQGSFAHFSLSGAGGVCEGVPDSERSGMAGFGAGFAAAMLAALWAYDGWSCVLALSGSFDTLTDYVIFAAWIFYALNAASVFIFRRKMPHAERPYRTVGYPVLPVVFLLSAGWLIYKTLWAKPTQALIGLGIIALGLPIYFYWARRNPVSYHEPPTGEES